MPDTAPLDRPAVEVALRSVDSLIPYARNARTHSPEQVAQIAASIEEFGWTNPILADEVGIIAGHGRLLAARQLIAAGHPIKSPSGMVFPEGHVPVIDVSGWPEAKRRAYILADNQLALNAGWDMELLKLELGDLRGLEYDLHFTGFADSFVADLLPPLDGSAAGASNGPSGAGSLAAKFGIPPFTVLNAREGWWQERKSAWLALGIRSEVGRGDNLLKMSDTALEPDPVKRKAMQEQRARNLGRDNAAPGGGGGGAYEGRERGGGGYQPEGGSVPKGLAFGEMPNYDGSARSVSGTSIFDPVLCELAYRWFCPPGGIILDPFAGGSVRGIVAAKLGREYVGFELRPEQVEANRAQASEICGEGIAPAYIEGDSRLTITAQDDLEADFVWTCPPYGDLEVYSDDDADLSAMAHSAFIEAYNEIIAAAVAKLKDNRFAAVCVGDFRDKDGLYRNFVSDTIAAFQAGGATLYNEAILVTAVGSLPIRTAKQFTASRKLGRTHQNVLIFVKGNPKEATRACGECNFAYEDELKAQGAEAEETSPDDRV